MPFRSLKSSSEKSNRSASSGTRIVKATIAYHGAKFSGWQIQRRGERTVQSVFEDALQKAAGQRPKLSAASRTDAGVHAKDQILQFELRAKDGLTAERLKNALNFHLPDDVAVRKIQFVPRGFSARFGPKAKHYRYEIHASRAKPVFDTDTCIWVHPDLDTAKMREAAKYFVGRHDFTSFSAFTEDAEDRVRTIRKFSVSRKGDRIVCDIVGDGFLRHMVRIMMGTLIEIGKGVRPVTDIPHLLKTPDRKKAGRTAAPHGLTLLKVYY